LTRVRERGMLPAKATGGSAMPTRRQFVSAALAQAAVPGIFVAKSEAAPAVDRTAQMVVGFAAGGGTDVSARIFADRLRGVYAPAVIVENKVGVAGRLSVEYVKNAPPDGAVMLYTTDFPITLYPHLYKKLAYDSLRDLTPVAAVTKSALVLSVGPMVPREVTTVKGFLDWCRGNPQNATYATTGAGGTPHFVGVMVSKVGGVPLLAVHYKGGAPALQDVMGGHIAASVNPSSEAIPMAKAGQVRILAVASSQRSRFLPDVPTLREQGLDVAFDTWTGVFLPARAPAPIVAALASAIEAATKAPEVIEAQSNLGNELSFQPPGPFAATVAASLKRWGEVVAISGFAPED
jgi:tripartite-type tricarboxylate transporter receptor subunit TctC